MDYFRRTALSETRRMHGTEEAKDLAGHGEYSDTLKKYYDRGLDVSALLSFGMILTSICYVR